MQKGMGGDEQHGMSVMPCTLCSQHGAKKSAEREELYKHSNCSIVVSFPYSNCRARDS